MLHETVLGGSSSQQQLQLHVCDKHHMRGVCCCKASQHTQDVHHRNPVLCCRALRVLDCTNGLEYNPRRLEPGDVQAAGLLLARAFSGTPEAVKLDEAV